MSTYLPQKQISSGSRKSINFASRRGRIVNLPQSTTLSPPERSARHQPGNHNEKPWAKQSFGNRGLRNVLPFHSSGDSINKLKRPQITYCTNVTTAINCNDMSTNERSWLDRLPAQGRTANANNRHKDDCRAHKFMQNLSAIEGKRNTAGIKLTE